MKVLSQDSNGSNFKPAGVFTSCGRSPGSNMNVVSKMRCSLQVLVDIIDAVKKVVESLTFVGLVTWQTHAVLVVMLFQFFKKGF